MLVDELKFHVSDDTVIDRLGPVDVDSASCRPQAICVRFLLCTDIDNVPAMNNMAEKVPSGISTARVLVIA